MRQVGRRSRAAVPVAQLTAAAIEANGCGGPRIILYIDRCALTRHCVANELAKLLVPEFTLSAFCTVADAGSDASLLKQSCCIIYHAQSLPIDDAQFALDLRLIHEALSGIPIVVLSNLEAARNVVGALRQGVAGYVPTSLSPGIVSEAVRLVLAGGTFIPASAVFSTITSLEPRREGSSIDRAPAAIGLTPRQSEVLHHLWTGKQNKAIAHELGMSENTVKVHIKHIMKKLGAHNRTQAVLMTREMFGENFLDSTERALGSGADHGAQAAAGTSRNRFLRHAGGSEEPAAQDLPSEF